MKGLMYEFLLVCVGLFAFAGLFIMFDQAYSSVHSFGTANFVVNDSDRGDFIANFGLNALDSLWLYFPIFVLFLGVLYMIIKAQKRDLLEGT